MNIKWLYPGLGVKRWIGLTLLGMLMVFAGMVFLIALFLPSLQRLMPSLHQGLVGYGPWLYGIMLLLAGVALVVLGLIRAIRALTMPVAGQHSLVELIYANRYLEKGPRVVVIGGGTGIPVLLRGLKAYTGNLTAIVTVADDGGSSGRLRGDLGILPPGDIRNCLVAMARREPEMEELLQYRFSSGELKGHNMGNLLLAALCDSTGGFDRAVHSLSRVLAVRGQVLPVTLSDVQLCGEMEDGRVVRGESRIPASGGRIKRVFLDPATCIPTREALEAIWEADLIVMGPGSLYTSILPNLLVPGIAEAIAASPAARVYIGNVMTQPGETDGYTASRHLQAIIDHAGPLVDYMIVNTQAVPNRLRNRYLREGAVPVDADLDAIRGLGVLPVADRLLQEGEVVRHHPEQLARLVMQLAGRGRQPERVVLLHNYIAQKKVQNA